LSNEHDPFEVIAQALPAPLEAPSTLKSRIYSELVRLQAEQGPLLSLAECRRAGAELCVFERLVIIAPLGEAMKSANPCRVCHARILGERVENAPIWWPGCPYVRFQNR
jgi:hypothetical protein